MKRLFLFITVLVTGFTMAACAMDIDFVDDIQDSIGDVESKLEDLQGEIDSLQGDIDDLTALVESMDSDLGDMQDDIDALLANISSLQADLNAMQNSVDALQGDVDALEALIDSMNDDMEAQFALMEAQIEALEETLLEKMAETTLITIAHTNDIHGRFEVDGRGSMGFGHVKSVYEMLLRRNPNTLLVDAGDTFHGTVFANLAMGKTIADLMNMVGYDYLVPGNHDFNFGYEHLLTLRDYADFPFLSANVYIDEDRLFNPYMIQDIDGVKVGFFGLTSPETTFKTHPDNVEGLTFTDPVDEAALVVAELSELVDVVILIAHVGTAEDTEVTTIDIAEQVDGIHLIIDGHSHDNPDDNQWVNGTMIVSARQYLEYVGYVDILIVNGVVESIEANAIGTAEAALLGQNWEILQYISAAKEAQEEILAEVVAFTNVLIDGERSTVRSGEANSGNILTDAMLFTSDADIAITNGGGIRASIEEGDITVGDVIAMLPFGNMIVTVELTGAEIIDVLEAALSGFTGENEVGSFPHVAGISYTIDVSKTEDRITEVLFDGEPIDLDATYIVATNDFLAAGGDGYPHFKDNPIISEYGTLDAAFIDYITSLDDLTDYEELEGRITIIDTIVQRFRDIYLMDELASH